MGKRIYVGNLPWSVSSDDLRELFEQHGGVADAVVVMDRATNRSRGFGFVEMETEEAMKTAIEAVDGLEMEGRQLVANEARERQDRGGGGGRGGGRGGRY